MSSTAVSRRTRLTTGLAVAAALTLTASSTSPAFAAERHHTSDAKATKVLERVTAGKPAQQAGPRKPRGERTAKRSTARTKSARSGRYFIKYDLGCVSFSDGLTACGTNNYFDVAVHIWDNGRFTVGWISFDQWNYLVQLHYAQ
jgi:hypothetical protein